MKTEEYQVACEVESTYRWYVGRRRIFLALLDSPCGLSVICVARK